MPLGLIVDTEVGKKKSYIRNSICTNDFAPRPGKLSKNLLENQERISTKLCTVPLVKWVQMEVIVNTQFWNEEKLWIHKITKHQ